MILGLILAYLPSFSARFFQDDFLLLKVAAEGNWLTPVAGFPFRPLSIHAFYTLGVFLFGNNPIGFHVLLFLFFLGGVFFLWQIARLLLKSDTAAIITVIIYAFNVALSPLFYWIATSYMTLAIFFVFSGTYFYLRGRKYDPQMTVSMFVFGLLSNELVVVFPALLLAVDLYLKKFNPRRSLFYIGISLVYIYVRTTLAVLPGGEAYALNFNIPSFLATFRWYFLRIFNLPEGVKISAGIEIYILFVVILTLVLVTMVVLLRKKIFPFRLGFFALWWFLAGALPFYFLPNHMSAYYLGIALLGPSMFLAQIMRGRKMVALFLCSYLLLSVLGLNYLASSHWIILKLTK